MRLQLAVGTLCLASLVAVPSQAQEASPGRLEGTVVESVPSRAVQAASVSLTRLEPAPNLSFAASPDAQGRYRVDSLPPGRYDVQLLSPTLDSLELALPARELRIEPGRTARADFTLPSGSALRDAVCAGAALGKGTGVVAGRAMDADTELSLVGAEVVVSWSELSVNPATLATSTEERSGAVTTGARGEYRLCGVPTGQWLSVQLQHAERASAALRVMVTEAEGAVVRNLSLSAAAPTIASLDSAAVDSTLADPAATELRLSGTATLAGTVRNSAGLPLADVQIRVRDARPVTTTNAEGRFVLAGLPAGTQLLVARRLGYALAELPVELRAGASVSSDVELARTVTLDSIRTTALRSHYSAFDFARGANIFGRFLTAAQIAQRNVSHTSELIDRLGRGFTVIGAGKGARVYTIAGWYARPACEVNVVVDGVEEMGINDFPPTEVVGIEAYPKGTGQFRTNYGQKCGLIVVWTTEWARKQNRLARDTIVARRND